ncbi:hypothetical protein [Streptomyces sp. NPDC057002]
MTADEVCEAPKLVTRRTRELADGVLLVDVRADPRRRGTLLSP